MRAANRILLPTDAHTTSPSSYPVLHHINVRFAIFALAHSSSLQPNKKHAYSWAQTAHHVYFIIHSLAHMFWEIIFAVIDSPAAAALCLGQYEHGGLLGSLGLRTAHSSNADSVLLLLSELHPCPCNTQQGARMRACNWAQDMIWYVEKRKARYRWICCN